MPPVGFDRLQGFAEDDALAAFRVFRETAAALVADAPPLRPALAPPPELLDAARAALAAQPRDAAAARAFFIAAFEPRPIGRGFLTGYYEPWVEGALAPSAEFTAPL